MNKNWTRGAADQGERALKRHGRTKAIVTDGLRSDKAALKDLGRRGSAGDGRPLQEQSR